MALPATFNDFLGNSTAVEQRNEQTVNPVDPSTTYKERLRHRGKQNKPAPTSRHKI